MSAKATLDRFIEWRNVSNPGITTATVAVRTKTLRKALGLKAKDPLVYRGLAIKCVGSKRWRYEHPGEPA